MEKVQIELDIEALYFLSDYCSSKTAIKKYKLADPTDLICCGNVWRTVVKKLQELEKGFPGEIDSTLSEKYSKEE